MRSAVAERGVLANLCEGKEISNEITSDLPSIFHQLINIFSARCNYVCSYRQYAVNQCFTVNFIQFN